MMNQNVRRVGMRLACLCRSCKNTVGDCQMMGCGYAGSARTRIVQMQTVGASDDQVVAKFVSERGTMALAVPPAEGFNLAVWVAPFAMLLVGLYAIYVYLQRARIPAAVPAAVSVRHQELAGKDLDQIS
jgi:cytochrome c-type biogenesis protein CcmH